MQGHRLRLVQQTSKSKGVVFWVALGIIAAAGVGGVAVALQAPPSQHLAGKTPCQSIGDNICAPSSPDAFDVSLAGENPLPVMKFDALDEAELRDALKAETKRLFLARDFAALEHLAEIHRTNDRLTPAGSYKAQFFYDAFESCHCENGGAATAEWLAIARAWRAAYPASPTPLLVEALLIEDDAWRLRGSGYASETSRAQFAGFYNRLRDAWQLLEANGPLASKEPHVHVMIARFARVLGANESQFEKVIDELVTQAPTYTTAWFSAADYGAPIWANNPAYVEHIAARAGEATRAELGDAMYTRVLFHAWSHGQERIFDTAGVDRKRFWRGARDLISRYPDKHNFQVYADLACQQQEWEIAEQLIQRMQVLAMQSYTLPSYATCRRDLYYRRR